MISKYYIIHGSQSLKRHFKRCCSMASRRGNPIRVRVKQGTIIGNERILPNGKDYNSFQGIPYAMPPVGDMKFRPPVPVKSFPTAEIDCTKEGDVSFQRDPFTGQTVGSDNCLFLNIYAPQSKSNLPVMVFIHGGGFIMGSGNSDYYLPLYLMQEDVIVVTMNYRLGSAGFLSMPNEGIYGNAGLKDQRLALQWIQENISQFNGNPDNVTLFGESAGAAAVHLHLYSENSKGLFHKAIMQSGTANMEWVLQSNATYKSHKLAELRGCCSKNSKDILAFLQTDQQPGSTLHETTIGVLDPDERRRTLPLPFKPVIEEINEKSVIDRPVLELLNKPNAVQIPIIMGHNSAEGITMMVNAVKKLDLLDKDISRFIPRNIDVDASETNELAQRIREFYFNGQPINEKVLNNLSDLLSDFYFVYDMQLAAKLHVTKQHNSPLYFYNFDYVGGLNMFKKLFQMDKLKGACHADELFYLFQMSENNVPLEPGNNDYNMVTKLCKLWTNFAKYDNPTPTENNPLNFAWTPVKKVVNAKGEFMLDYLSIDKDPKMLQNPMKSRMDFWNDVYKTFKTVPLTAKL